MSTSIDQQFIEYIVKTVVGNPDAVSIERTIDEKGVLLELTVDPEDLGRVIGKRGAGAQALRTLLRALGTKNDARYNLKIIDNGEPRERREDHRSEERSQSAPVEESSDLKDEAPRRSAPVEQTEEEPAAPQPTPEEPEQEEETRSSSMADKTRKELADLDDLDI